MKNIFGQQDLLNGMSAAHFSFQTFCSLAEWSGLFRNKK